MKTRSQMREEKEEVKTEKNEEIETSDESEKEEKESVTNEEVERCEDCDEDIKIGEGFFIKKKWYCQNCSDALRSSELSSSSINFKIAVVILLLSIVISLSFFSYNYFVLTDSPLPATSHESKIDCNNETVLIAKLKDFKKQFPSQLRDSWLSFFSGIKSVYSFSKPTTFLLFHNDTGETANCLATKISKFVAECFTGTDDVVDIKNVDLEEEFIDDSGKFIELYKEKVSKKNVMVVRNLNDFPGNIVREFHFFCDNIQPLVKRAVYFFTMSAADRIDSENIMSDVAHTFKKTWNDLHYSNLDPLVTRMTGNIIHVIREQSYVLKEC